MAADDQKPIRHSVQDGDDVMTFQPKFFHLWWVFAAGIGLGLGANIGNQLGYAIRDPMAHRDRTYVTEHTDSDGTVRRSTVSEWTVPRKDVP